MAQSASSPAASWWNYLYKPAPVLDLAIFRILAVGLQLGLLVADKGYGQAELAEIAKLPGSYYHPLPLLKLILLPFGVSELSLSTMETVRIIAILSGFLALIGLFTNLSLGIFAFSCTLLQIWMYSYSDIHHPQAVMMISLTVLALSPAGKCLSIDSLLFRRNFPPRNSAGGTRRSCPLADPDNSMDLRADVCIGRLCQA